jgi:hypothetical protein
MVYRACETRLNRDVVIKILPELFVPYRVSQFNETLPALSPNGRWLAYQSNESGKTEVYRSRRTADSACCRSHFDFITADPQIGKYDVELIDAT